jgi:hypothetical protein
MKIALATLVVALSAFLLWAIYSSPQESVNEILPKPISSAFGITLGENFNPDMVKKILSKQKKTYKNKEGIELQGTMLHITPLQPSDKFQQYVINTNPEGIIYSIEGKYQNKEMTPAACKAIVKSMAEEMESIHGKPRGKDSFGQWYSFRQTSDYSKSLRLYAHRCRTGMYSIIYTDENIKRESNIL